MTTFEQYGILPCAFRIPVERDTQIVERDEGRWAIVENGALCLNADGEWEVEPQPSSRDDAFKIRTRWTLPKAMQIAVDHFRLGFAPERIQPWYLAPDDRLPAGWKRR